MSERLSHRGRGMAQWLTIVFLFVSVILMGASCSFSFTGRKGAVQPTGAQNINTTIVTPEHVPIIDGNAITTNGSMTTPSKTITITKDGFVPASVVIARGQTVRWINDDENPHWPASDPHPAHTDQPGLDPLSELVPGGTFLYTFIKSGTVHYHDHLNPENVGKVIVE